MLIWMTSLQIYFLKSKIKLYREIILCNLKVISTHYGITFNKKTMDVSVSAFELLILIRLSLRKAFTVCYNYFLKVQLALKLVLLQINETMDSFAWEHRPCLGKSTIRTRHDCWRAPAQKVRLSAFTTSIIIISCPRSLD